ncbi:MAG: YggT family protein [Ktedonobacteraceae bacterium]|nr:YggT family protein [Ktedonobacteraceae bacterium]
MRRRHKKAHHSAFYSEETEPALGRITAPLPTYLLPYDPWWRRLLWAVGRFCEAIVRKVNQLLGLALAVLLLLLFTRVVLTFFSLNNSLFVHWVYLLSDPLILPFTNLLPMLPFDGYRLDVSTLIAIVIYALVVAIVRQFIKVLVARS